MGSNLGHDGRLMFSKSLRYQQQTLRFSIHSTQTGWEVSEERDSQVVKKVQYQDWHRVERARRSISIELDALQRKGWAVES